jgi:hypothetical protein
MASESLQNQIISLLPTDFAQRLTILSGLQNHILQDELNSCRQEHRQRELANVQKNLIIQEQNAALARENERLRNELQKLDLIRTSVRDITTSSHVDVSMPAAPRSSSPLRSTASSYGEEMTTATPSMSISELSRVPTAYTSPGVDRPQHDDLLAAIDRRVARTSSISSSPASSRSFGGAGASIGIPQSMLSSSKSGSPRSIANGKAFFRECRRRLEKVKFDAFISDIRGLKVNSVTREDVFEKAKVMFGHENTDLIDQLRGLLYTV